VSHFHYRNNGGEAAAPAKLAVTVVIEVLRNILEVFATLGLYERAPSDSTPSMWDFDSVTRVA
jgi:hypothetical protein